MSDFITNDEIENRFSLVVRKPQEGKTFICITNIINDKRKNIHIILTMNTLSAGMQFFGRLQDEIGTNKIVVFNSKKQTAGECHFAKDIFDVTNYINKENVKVIVCCAHEKRIKESIPRILNYLSDSIIFKEQNIKLVIHIDEAHEYIPKNRQYIHNYNYCQIVSNIIGYSATPDRIWKEGDILFSKIYICDIEKELQILRSHNYFGVIDCNFITYDNIDHEILITESEIGNKIPSDTFRNAGMKESNVTNWYGSDWYFDCGNEILYLSFVKYSLPRLELPSNVFTYNFIPAYNRKATHYECMKLIINQYSTANVIVMNGTGTRLWRLQTCGSIVVIADSKDILESVEKIKCIREKKKQKTKLLEPSNMIQELIKDYPNCPTFVTGFTCVGMSVTLINKDIGNFDNVVMDHQHYNRDKLYQLCRFQFNYNNWSEQQRSKIKKTNFHTLTKFVEETCRGYEKHINKICNEFVGTTCSLNQINGREPDKPTEKEIKMDAFNNRTFTKKGVKKFKVYDNNDDESWEKTQQFYYSIRNKRCSGNSLPKKNEFGFYMCSDTINLGVKPLSIFNDLGKEMWSSRFCLKSDKLSYARVFVGYDNLDDATEYTIFIKYAVLEDTESNKEFLNKYESAKSKENE